MPYCHKDHAIPEAMILRSLELCFQTSSLGPLVTKTITFGLSYNQCFFLISLTQITF